MHAAALIKKLPAAKTQRRRYYITTRQSSKMRLDYLGQYWDFDSV